MQSPAIQKWFSGLVIAALLMTSWGARAADPDEQYLRILGLIQQADTLNTSGQAGPALAKYQEAQTALRNFQKSYLSWNAKVVSYRQNYVAEKIAALSEKDSPSAAGSREGEPQTQSSSSTPQVKLLEAGAEPRKVLRLHPKAGDKQTMVMTMKMGMEMKMGEVQNPMKLPAMIITMDATVKTVSTDGDITYETVVSDASLTDEADVMPQVAEAMKSSFASIKGMTGTGTLSSRGFNKGAEIKVPAGADPQVRQTMEQMKESLSKVSAPLPEEAVGVGAKWEARMVLKSQGMTINQTATYELISLEGERVTAKNTITQNAANQKIQSPTMPGMAVDLTKMVTQGTGELTFDLSRLLPPEATMDSHSDLSMAMNIAGKKQAMTMKMDMNLRVETK